VLFMFTLFVVAGGRYVNVQGDADSTARDAARAASLTRTQGEAEDAVRAAIRDGLSSTRSCRGVDIDLSDFQSGGTANVRLQCSVSLADLGLLGIKKEITFDADGHAPIDTYRRTG
jgi:Flp pilus assembly protein TadG